MSSINQKRVILVTGANKGLGFEVIKKLIGDSYASTNDLILLGTRDLQRGQDAIAKLGYPSNVHLLQLDVSSANSIVHATNEIKQKYGGQLDILINNAGITTDDVTIDAAREIFSINYYGVKLLNEYLSPLIKQNGRIVNVASGLGAWVLNEMSTSLRDMYLSPTLSKEQLDVLVKNFILAIGSGNVEKLGYSVKLPHVIYSTSKAALIALTRIEARQWLGARNVLILSVCPGFCATDLTKHAPGSRPAKLGADSILYVVKTPSYGLKNGGFYQDDQLRL